MCGWSNWSFLCDGRYDIALAILIGMAFLVALSFIVMSYMKKRSEHARADDLAIVRLKGLYQQGDIDADQFLNRCDKLARQQSVEKVQTIWKAGR